MSMSTEKQFKSAARIAGALFLVQMTAASVSHSALLAPILGDQDFLTRMSTDSTTVTIAMLLDLLCGAAVFGISVLLFPLLKKFNENIALWYVGLRLNEWVCVTVSGIFLMTLLSVSDGYIHTNTSDQGYLLTLGTYLLKARGITKILMLLGFCLSSTLFYYLLFVAKLLPRFITVWGLIGIAFLFAEVMSNIFGRSLGGIVLMLPMGLNEIFLGIWLIVKGFDSSAISTVSRAAR